MELARAKEIANKVAKEIEEFCDLVFIAGSVRRESLAVGDIELVVKIKPNMNNRLGMKIMQLGSVKSGKFDGRFVKVWLNEGVQLDLFIPQPHDFYRILAIRTGSDDYAHKTIANGWRRLGWVGTENGLRRQVECIETKNGWQCIAPHPIMPPQWESEADFFRWLGIAYLEPKYRR